MSLLDTLGRIPKILEANINALLDKCEDPAKMIDQLLVDYKRDLADVKKDTVEVMANEKLAKKRLDECDAEIAKTTKAAENALKAGDEEAARKLIASKQKLETTRASLAQNWEVCQQNVTLMRDGYNKLVENIEDLEQRKDAAKAKISLAKAQEGINKSVGVASSNKAMETFAKYEEEAEKRLAAAQAGAELDAATTTVDDLKAKYSGGADNASVDDELAKMKASLGL